MRTNSWDVYFRGGLIDTVFFDSSYDAGEVFDSLVDHDGYHSGILVSPGKDNNLDEWNSKASKQARAIHRKYRGM
jgi:hypothetical protein